jgi:hypothetical protein
MCCGLSPRTFADTINFLNGFAYELHNSFTVLKIYGNDFQAEYDRTNG